MFSLPLNITSLRHLLMTDDEDLSSLFLNKTELNSVDFENVKKKWFQHADRVVHSSSAIWKSWKAEIEKRTNLEDQLRESQAKIKDLEKDILLRNQDNATLQNRYQILQKALEEEQVAHRYDVMQLKRYNDQLVSFYLFNKSYSILYYIFFL